MESFQLCLKENEPPVGLIFRNEHESVIGIINPKLRESAWNNVKFRLMCVNEKLNFMPDLTG